MDQARNAAADADKFVQDRIHDAQSQEDQKKRPVAYSGVSGYVPAT